MNIIIILFVVWVGFYTVHSARQRMGHYKELVDPGDGVRQPCYIVTMLLNIVFTFAEIYCVIVMTSKTLDMIYCALREARENRGQKLDLRMDHRHKDNELLAEKEYKTNIFHTQLPLWRNSTKKELEYLEYHIWKLTSHSSKSLHSVNSGSRISSRFHLQEHFKPNGLNRNFNIKPGLHALTLNFGGNQNLLCINILKGTSFWIRSSIFE